MNEFVTAHLVDEDDRPLENVPKPSVFGESVVDPAPSVVADVTGQRSGDDGTDHQRGSTQQHLVPLQFR